MACDEYLELLSARLDGALTGAEERELEGHLAACPDCRAVGAQLSALQGAFSELEDIPAPEGFAQGVMDRIRAEEAPKVIPLFKRPQVRALAGLAACLVVAAGLYSVSRPKKAAGEDMMLRSFSKDAVVEFSGVPSCESLTTDEDIPQVTAYAAPEADTSAGTAGMEKAAPSPDLNGLPESRLSSVELSENTLAMDYFPEGAAELLPPETAAQPYPGGGTVYLNVPKDIYDQIQRLAVEQGMTFSCALTGDGGAENGPFTLIILEE